VTNLEAQPASPAGRHRRPTVYGGDETLDVVGESAHQDKLWALSGKPPGSRVDKEIVAVLEPEPTNAYDRHAVQVLINDMTVGHLTRGLLLSRRWEVFMQFCARIGVGVRLRPEWDVSASP
jgi:hypothetical protein